MELLWCGDPSLLQSHSAPLSPSSPVLLVLSKAMAWERASLPLPRSPHREGSLKALEPGPNIYLPQGLSWGIQVTEMKEEW